MKITVVKFGKNNIGNNLRLTIISGPCVVESKQHAIDVAGKIDEICMLLGINFIYKSSFDKANRTSIKSSRGLGLKKEDLAPWISKIGKWVRFPAQTSFSL